MGFGQVAGAVGELPRRERPAVRAALDLVEKMARQFKIRIAIHNHGPGDKKYPSPLDVLKMVKDRDELMGVCMDVGHSVRLGEDPVVPSARETAGVGRPRPLPRPARGDRRHARAVLWRPESPTAQIPRGSRSRSGSTGRKCACHPGGIQRQSVHSGLRGEAE